MTFDKFQMQVDGGEWQDFSHHLAGVPVIDTVPGIPDVPLDISFFSPLEFSVTFSLTPQSRHRLIKMFDQPRRKAAYERRYRNGA